MSDDTPIAGRVRPPASSAAVTRHEAGAKGGLRDSFAARETVANPPYDSPWPLRRLKDVTGKIGSGATPTGGAGTYATERDRWALVRSQNVLDRGFDDDGLAFISEEQATRLEASNSDVRMFF